MPIREVLMGVTAARCIINYASSMPTHGVKDSLTTLARAKNKTTSSEQFESRSSLDKTWQPAPEAAPEGGHPDMSAVRVAYTRGVTTASSCTLWEGTWYDARDLERATREMDMLCGP